MASYIQKTNRNSFTLRYKKYKRFRSDIWGNISFVNKKNIFTTTMKNFAMEDLRKHLRSYPKKKKKILYKKFSSGSSKRIFNRPFEYSVKQKAQAKRKLPLTLRGETSLLRKKIKAFYFCRLRRKSLRKHFSRRSIKKRRLQQIPFYSLASKQERFSSLDSQQGSVASIFEARIDVILYRLNFIPSIYDGRRIIKTKKAFVLGPCKRKRIYRKFFSFFTLKKHYYKVPLFHFVSLRYDLSLLRKITLKNLVFAAKLLSYPPDYFMVSYKTMIGLRVTNPPLHKVRYPFFGTLAYFIGTALYF